MKVENKEVSIKSGQKEIKFTNMILNSYLELFADSFIDFQRKDLEYCLINFTQFNDDIDENSTTMNYDLVLNAVFNETLEVLSETSITNKYYYQNEVYGYSWDDFKDFKIKEIGFAKYDSELEDYKIYAFLDVSNYEIYVQDSQPIIIARTDVITSDMNLWANSEKVKAPYHLTMRGMTELKGMNYNMIIPKLYSVGFGVLPYTLNKEYLIEDLTVAKGEIGTIYFEEALESQYRPNAKCFNTDIYFDTDWYFEEPSYDYMIYKFKLYEETYPDPEGEPVLVDTGLYYLQYKKIDKYENLKLYVKYERS